MLELGAGFNPELSGEENILLFGVLLGNSIKDMRSKAIEIADQARREGFGSLRESALRKVAAGLTSLEEANRVV